METFVEAAFDIAETPSSPQSSLEARNAGKILLNRHQEAVGAQEIVLLPDDDVNVVFGTNILTPPDWLVRDNATVVLHDRPWTRQRIVDRGDFIVQKTRIGFVEINLFLDEGATVFVERNAAGVVGAGVFETARFDHQHVVPAVAVLVDPFAYRIARKHGIGIHVLGPRPSV